MLQQLHTQFAIAALLLAPAAALGGVAQFDNTVPVLDVNGAQVDAHDGMIVQFDAPHGLYWRYSIEYGNYSEVGHLRSNGGGCANHCGTCGGFRMDHNVSVWTSPTLESGSWTLVTREALPIASRPVGSYYRPKVVYNPTTKTYVLWVNYAPGGYDNAGKYLSATSPTPAGPFTIAIADVVMDPWTGNHGDFDLFRDGSGEGASAYILYTCYCGPGGSSGGTTVSTVLLTPDFLNATTTRSAPLANGAGTNAPVWAESPAFFSSGGFYFALITHVCCFCRQGGGVSVFTAEHPLGPWSGEAYDIGCANGTAVDGCSSSVGEWNVPACGGQGYSWSGAQQNNVFAASTAAGTLWIWTADRWYSSPDAIKGHDLQHWAPLSWGPPNPKAPFPTAPTIQFIGNPLQWNFTLPSSQDP